MNARERWQDPLVPWLLLFGGIFFVVGWVIGLVWLWTSPTWQRQCRWLATLLWPGGLATTLIVVGLVLTHTICTGFPSGSGPHALSCVTHVIVVPEPWAMGIGAVALIVPLVVVWRLEHVRRVRTCNPPPLAH
ncbi:MAG: hypothetical protein M0Z54_11950 [Thermaerobacter sp.]|nr:hypothetical protein [Thermaerobacter sp.]